VDQKIKKILRESILEYFDDYNDYSDISTLSDIDVDNKAYQTVRQLKIDKAIKEKLKTITWRDIKVSQKGPDFLRIILPYGKFSEGIYVMISVDSDNFNHMHIELAKSLQNLGLGYKIHKAVINYIGHIYSPLADRKNKLINNIYDRLSNDPELECFRNKAKSDLCFMKGKVNKPLLNKFAKLA
jgi:hypothetical protein